MMTMHKTDIREWAYSMKKSWVFKWSDECQRKRVCLYTQNLRQLSNLKRLPPYRFRYIKMNAPFSCSHTRFPFFWYSFTLDTLQVTG